MADYKPSHAAPKSSGRHLSASHLPPSHSGCSTKKINDKSSSVASRSNNESPGVREDYRYRRAEGYRSKQEINDSYYEPDAPRKSETAKYTGSHYSGNINVTNSSRSGRSALRAAGRKNRADAYDLILSIAFFAAIFIVGLVSVTDTDPTVSELENRTLKAYPVFSLSSLANGSFFLDFEEAYNDTFPSRDFWVTENASLKGAMTLKYEDSIEYDVTAGEFADMNGTLAEITLPTVQQELPEPETVLAEDSVDNTLYEPEEPQIEEPEAEPVVLPPYSFDISGFEQFVGIKAFVNGLIVGDRGMYVFSGSATNAEYFCQACYAIKSLFPNANLISVLVPESSAYYGREQDKTDYHDQQAYTELIRKNTEGYMTVPDVYSALEQHKDEYIYFKTDHHWTQLGAYYAYLETMNALGYDAVDINTLEQGEIDYFLGSFYKNFNSDILKNNPDSVSIYYPSVTTSVICHNDRRDLSVSKTIDLISEPDVDPKTGNKYLCFIEGDNPLTEIETNAGTGKTAIVIKSSHGNCFIPWLCHNYDKIYAIDPRHVNTKETNVLVLSEFFADEHIDDIIICGGCNSANKADFLSSMSYLISGMTQ